MIIQILISLFIVPYSQDKSRSYIRSSGIDFLPNLMKERKFIDTVSNLTIYIDKVDSNNKYTNIILKDEITDNKSQIIYAKKGELIKENENFYLILNDGEIINLNNDRIDKFNFEKTVFNISKFSTKTTTYPKIQERRTTTLLKCLRYLNNKIIYGNYPFYGNDVKNKKTRNNKKNYFSNKTPFASKVNSFFGAVIMAISSFVFPASSA